MDNFLCPQVFPFHLSVIYLPLPYLSRRYCLARGLSLTRSIFYLIR